MARMSLKQKILVLCALFLVPISYLLYATVSAYDKDYDFAQLETIGLQTVTPAVNLLSLVVQYHALNLRDANESSNRKENDSLKSAMALEFSNLDRLLNVHGSILQMDSQKLASLHLEHLAVNSLTRKRQSAQVEGSYQAIISLTTDLRNLISRIGDTSNLVLDPDLDSYYLIDALIQSLPRTLDRIVQIQEISRSNKQNHTTQSTNHSEVLNAMLQEYDLAKTQDDLKTAILQDPNFYGQNSLVQGTLEPGLLKVNETGAKIASLLSDPKPSSNADELINQTEVLGAQTSELWKLSSAATEQLLAIRMAYYQDRKVTAIVISLVSLILFATLTYFAVGRISSFIERQSEEMVRHAVSVAKVSEQTKASAQAAALSTSEHSSAIEETVSSMEEISSMIGATSQNASLAHEEAKLMAQGAESGQEAVRQMVEAMEEISATNDSLQKIIKVIDDISGKTRIINDIAFETRLLAFNASIEAARAGSHGRGFAVVAEEVGKLANVSNQAADDIRELLEHSVKDVAKIVGESRQRIDKGQRTTEICSKSFSHLLNSTHQIVAMVHKIRTAAEEQGGGVKQTNKAMQLMEKVAQSNARHGVSILEQASEMGFASLRMHQNATEMLRLVLGHRQFPTNDSSQKSHESSGAVGSSLGRPNDQSQPTQLHPTGQSDLERPSPSLAVANHRQVGDRNRWKVS